MKKNLFILTCAALALCFTSCTKNEKPSDSTGDENKEPVVPEYRLLENFEDGGMLTWTGADGCSFEIADNPSAKGINTSAKVGKVTAGGAQWEFTWSTSFGSNENPDYLVFSKDGYVIKVDVYAPKASVPVYLKIEGDNVPAVEITDVKTSKVNEWETLSFDYEPKQVVDGAYRNFVILFDAGVTTDGGEVFYYDNIRLCKE